MIHLYLTKIAQDGLLGITDKRTIIKWCQDNDVPIYRNKKVYVNYKDFEKAYNKEKVESIMKDYPQDQWEDVINYYNDESTGADTQNPQYPVGKSVQIEKPQRYVPQGKIGKKIKEKHLSIARQ